MEIVIMYTMAMYPFVSIDEKWIKIAPAHVLPPPPANDDLVAIPGFIERPAPPSDFNE